jgi:cytochrome P450
MEVEVMLAAFIRRFPRARASGAERHWHQRGPFRGLDELVVRVD